MKQNFLIYPLIIFLFACLFVVEAGTAKPIPRIGIISSTGSPLVPSPAQEAFRRGLQEMGYIEGKDVIIEHRYAEGKLDYMPLLVNELVQQKVDVIVALNNVVIRAAKAATKTIPIVMVSSIDPVSAGYIESFAYPGGNITGLTHMGRDLSGKRIELLKEMIPKLSRMAVLWDADGPGPAVAFQKYKETAQALKLQLRSLEVRGPNPDFEGVFLTAKNARAEAIIVVGNPLIGQHQNRIFELALKNRIPTMTEDSRYVQAGGLISYGASLAEIYRGTAIYVDAILKGAKPGDLRVKQPDAFEIFINLKTAKQIGATIPKYVLIRANEVIE